jgi:ribosomal protein S18 acetylase RimI-like enzyme
MLKARCEPVLMSGYSLRRGSGLDRAQLLKFMHRTYRELYPAANFDHLAQTVDLYLSHETPLWWAEAEANLPVACLWLGLAVDQVSGQQYPHIFLVYVSPEHRRRGLGSALMRQAEDWAKARGDAQIGLQVFQQNQPALGLYQKLGFEPVWIGMVKPLGNMPAR